MNEESLEDIPKNKVYAIAYLLERPPYVSAIKLNARNFKDALLTGKCICGDKAVTSLVIVGKNSELFN